MQLKEAVSKAYTRKDYIRLAVRIGRDNERFRELIDLLSDSDICIIQKASNILLCCVELHPDMIRGHLRKLVTDLSRSNADTLKRNILRILQFVQIPSALQGRTADICFRLLQNKKEAVGIKVFAITVLYNIGLEIPELKHELRIVIEDLLPYETAAFKSRGSKILKKLYKND